MAQHEVRLQLAAVTVAEELSFTRAAERLKITQPGLSRQIAELEGRIGFAVFKRNQKRIESPSERYRDCILTRLLDPCGT